MIYTVTLNPSLDYIITVNGFELGKTNRTVTEQMVAGGKGINVSTVLKNLEIPSIVMGFTAGFVGEHIEEKTKKEGLSCEFVKLPQGCSRINVKMKDFDGTEINGQGPVANEAAIGQLFGKLNALQTGDILVLAGSSLQGMPDNIYEMILEKLQEKGVLCVVDAGGQVLRSVLSKRPFLIKPNKHELEEFFDAKIDDRQSVIYYAGKLREMGAGNVMVSLGGDGAIFVAENGEVYSAKVPEGELVNAVGAGDSMVAGFLAYWMMNGSIEEKKDTLYKQAFRMAVCAGSASAFSENLATKEQIYKLFNSTFSVEKI